MFGLTKLFLFFHSGRWYALGLLFCVALISSIASNTWAPIEHSSQAVFGWGCGDLALLSDWGVITFMIAVFPTAWMLDTKGGSGNCMLKF